MMRIVTALAVRGLVASGRALADGDTSRTTTTTERKTDGDGVKTTMETKSKSDGAAGETTRDERFTVEKHAAPDGNTEVKKDVKTSHKRRASRSAHRTRVEQTTVRDAQGNVISEEKKVKQRAGQVTFRPRARCGSAAREPAPARHCSGGGSIKRVMAGTPRGVLTWTCQRNADGSGTHTGRRQDDAVSADSASHHVKEGQP